MVRPFNAIKGGSNPYACADGRPYWLDTRVQIESASFDTFASLPRREHSSGIHAK